MSDFSSGELLIKIEDRGDDVIMEWTGRSRDRDPSGLLLPFFDELVAKTIGKKLKIDFQNLISMNSSTVPPIVELVKNLEKNNITTEIQYNAESEWQKASFKALETVVMGFECVKVHGL